MDVDELAAESVEALRKAVDELTAQLQANAVNARGAGSVKLDEGEDAVRRNPPGALALAAGAGLLVGLWRQRNVR